MANIAFEQLTIIAQRLAEIDEQMKDLKAKEEKLKKESSKLLKEYGETSAKTIFGTLTQCKGKEQKSYNSNEYLKAKEKLEIAKVKAESRKQYTISTGSPYIRFTT